ncbi:hypothetical protein SAMN05443662_0704 [Sulfurivirga caldicuralii]|uniref:YecA family protein n=1 Tax=Sulfurivirga caldicuralii TaxID=364032 RepID=A0A1N6EP78_9GAMM|nr:UPF0149 family protein [Sulfurivirga caldicuralii]SIN84846.1 hypothetical protein SAMN05443662_0704 [Sulfurivirga caldicuralii]
MKEICPTVERIVREWPELESPAFLHGMLTGELCGAEKLEVGDFIKGLLQEIGAESVKEKALQTLYVLYDETLKGLTSSDFSLELCLPDEARPLIERARAVGQWCEGFLYGFGLTHPGRAKLGEEVKEYLETLQDVADIDSEALKDVEDEQMNAQLEEIIEFIRIGAIAVYENLHPAERKPIELDTIPEPTHKTVQ